MNSRRAAELSGVNSRGCSYFTVILDVLVASRGRIPLNSGGDLERRMSGEKVESKIEILKSISSSNTLAEQRGANPAPRAASTEDSSVSSNATFNQRRLFKC